MNQTSLTWNAGHMNIDYLNSRQLSTLTVINLIIMVVNVTGKTLVIYVLIKTNQTAPPACTLIFMLSISDFLEGAIGQNFFTVIIYGAKRSVTHSLMWVSIFLAHLSSYTIAIIGIDRYVRIKYCTHFRTIWTTKVIISLTCVGCLLTLFQAITLTVALTFQKVVAIIPFNVVIDGFIVGIILLQLLTIRRSTAVSTAGESNFHKKIVKLSTRIMLLFCFFVTPFVIILNLLRNIDQDKLNENHKSTLQFIFCFSIVFFNGNSFANTILFLTTNVKVKTFLQTFLKWYGYCCLVNFCDHQFRTYARFF